MSLDWFQVVSMSIKSHRQQALDRQWTQKWQSPHIGDATTQNLSNAVCRRRDSFLAFTQHPHATCAQRARLVGAHAAVTPYQSTDMSSGWQEGQCEVRSTRRPECHPELPALPNPFGNKGRR